MTSNFARTIGRRGALWKLGSDLAGRAFQYALLWVAARNLAQSDFGDFTFALSIGYMLAQVADFGLQLYVQRELSRLVEHDAAVTNEPTDMLAVFPLACCLRASATA